ncbi:M3 family metallopeptidase [Weeksellaceae bacterium KMM 9713]|uniref:oligopeptidase A n=1 Tax=Profundicola chukchiensis TaxID=2961959 RepID=A0A9X4RTM4_9FLAO|nr:M3 family metallopeptidase [Profundicola chukchiensis]MDG4945178.1 M3 family metallopeptidase [Profundicola chukchiensis]
MNPLLDQPFSTPFQTPPFSKFSTADFKPAIEKAIEEAKEEIKAIVDNTASPSFENTIEALTLSGEKLDRITSIFFNLNSAETNKEIQKTAQEVSPLLSEFSNDIVLNENLFSRIKSVYDHKESFNLNEEQQELLRKTFRRFTRNGANLSEEDKTTLREIDKKLSKLSLQFGENVLAETNDYQLHITNQADLAGLPDYAMDMAQQEAEKRGLEGWVFTLHMPSYLAFQKFADQRELREKLYKASGAKAFQDNERNNENIIKEIVSLRYQRAQLLGYKTHADFVLEERMAKSPQKVLDFLNDLLEQSIEFAKKDIQSLAEYAEKTDGIKELMPWDHAYYAEKVKKEQFDLSDEELKPYFELNAVLQGAFSIAQKLYDISFVPNQQIETYHPDVKVFEVKDSTNETIGIFYTDFFPREGKRAGAWMTNYRNGSKMNGVHKIPQISIVCNFTQPTKDKPSLLTFNELTTLFHEFGHALHGLLANTQYEALAGTQVSWDFVELPSQFMENYCYEPEALALFAKHYETGEVIPQALIDKIIAAAQFLEGYQMSRQISFGKLDMAWHAVEISDIEDVDAYEIKAFEGTQVYPKVEGTNMSTAFSHIFQGGYSSGYYSYKWAEVLDADAFDYFKQNGIFDKATANKFKTLLTSGGTVDPMVLYKNFRGREPQQDALLKRVGIKS